MLYPGLARVWGQPMPLYVYATFTENFWLAHHSWDAYMGVTWSLAVEEQFYLTLPFIIRFVPRERLSFVVGLLALASAVTRTVLYLHFGNDWGTAAYTLMFCRADALMLGVLGALAMRNAQVRTLLSERPWILRAAVVVFGGGVTVLLIKGWTMQTRPMSTLGYTCVSLFYTSLLLIAVVRTHGWWARVMRLSSLRWLGNLAYCLYLLHGPTFTASCYLLRGRPHPDGPDWAAAALGLVLALGLSYLSWQYFESKMIRIGHRFSYAASVVPRDRRPHILVDIDTPAEP
jgi:peptidoglycan/LPS O-acetylase OafA/YrhL